MLASATLDVRLKSDICFEPKKIEIGESKVDQKLFYFENGNK